MLINRKKKRETGKVRCKKCRATIAYLLDHKVDGPFSFQKVAVGHIPFFGYFDKWYVRALDANLCVSGYEIIEAEPNVRHLWPEGATAASHYQVKPIHRALPLVLDGNHYKVDGVLLKQFSRSQKDQEIEYSIGFDSLMCGTCSIENTVYFGKLGDDSFATSLTLTEFKSVEQLLLESVRPQLVLIG